MVIFAIIMFALAAVRTLTKFAQVIDNEESFGSVLGAILVAVTYWWCYIWFLMQYITLK